ncbi:hypothetical protein [Chryseobacterium echinoideorum]|uniref:hypothetical protein n=1 Tax=Chryseobacterium echinoideorum TaxID=1549648 RepID=UPI00118601F6|nr:hypothetical protein [Chryseobacterium echinoideorum]
MNAQLNLRFPLFSDSINDNYFLNYGVSLCNPKDGSLEEALKFQQNDNLKNNPKNLNYLQYLINFQTEGKVATFENIEKSQLSEKERDVLKLWLFSVTKNDDDFDKKLYENQNKYPNDIELKKIEIRKQLQDRQDLIHTEIDFSNIIQNINKIIVNNKLSKNDEILFNLLKLDCEYYENTDTESMKTVRNKIMNEYSNFWKSYKSFFNDKYAKINFKLKSNNSAHYFELTNEDEPNDEIFEDYLFVMYGNPIQDIVGSDNKKYIAFLQTNPFYYGEWNEGLNLATVEKNPSPKKVKNYSDFILNLKKIENTINKFPGAVGPKYAYIDALIENKEIIYNQNPNVYLTKFLIKIIDIFSIDQRANLENHFTYFRDILKEDISSTKFNEYYKLIFQSVKKSNETEIDNYLINIEKKFPNNINLKAMIDKFHKL